ncbi:hypothetical protein [Pseudomonas sp. SJZ079]|uniref:hypothetical protein n=1 Tax=Pseudomonas sp. SJZ079 TaxID=2572887 RepID=UPI002113EC63|nr:hypothetical protein [Pseudomonas sp. SJZ079]
MSENRDKTIFDEMNEQWLPNSSTTSGSESAWHALMPSLATSILFFTFFALLLAAVLLWKKESSALDMLRLFGVILIVGLSSFLLVAGYSDDQLTPIVGLFGAIVGYLLGKDSGKGG